MASLKVGAYFGPFQILRILGRGSMGQVMLAVGPDKVPVALKLLTATKARAKARFAREIEVGTAIVHPNVVRVFSSGQIGAIPYLTMEFIKGKDLQQVLRSLGRFDPRIVLRFSRHLARGLGEFHKRGFVHRDLKPANLLLTPEGHLRIADLGLVHDPEDQKLTRTGAMVGTPWYASPEQARGKRPTPASDLFAMAIVLYLCLTGQHPFRSPEGGEENFMQYLIRLPRAIPHPWHPSAVDGPLDRVFRKAFENNPEDRFGSVRRFARALDQAFRAEKAGGRSVQETQAIPAIRS
jgi:serine/threonine-protein kinase